ncbi:hypothetical protein GZ77_11500 [Endozoicomonas montiporae]|uniref:DNA ligase (NAD(+)) n=2 Tax=Endozoicomonas montiporae TaxID=1027273 RepID=A0A081N8V9_9GAMM|nr:hypothetical protein GZ77_11500 [Endozoicomonas montiporae]
MGQLAAQASCPNWSDNEAQQQLEQLNQQIQHHNQLYFVQQKPVLSDHEYDALAKQLQVLSDCFPTIQLSEGTPQRLEPDSNGNRKIQHALYMSSLRKAESEQDISEFLKQVFSASYHSGVMLQPKIDGIAVELVYEEGKLTTASTRGDGIKGNNILAKVKAIPTIPHEINALYSKIVLHGELFVRLDLWDNKGNIKDNYSSARHFVAGVIHSKTPEISALEVLDFFPWTFWTGTPAKSLSENVNELYTLGFPLPTQFTEPVTSLEDVIKKRDLLQKQADRLPFLMDGIVLKVNSAAQQLAMRTSIQYPYWALAWKFPPETAVTSVQDIDFKVGRTGNITPVLALKPVELNKQNITSVSLGSLDNLKSKDIAIGDQVAIALKGSANPVFSKVVFRNPQRKHPKQPEPEQYNSFTCLSLAPGCEEQFIARILWLVRRLELLGLDEPIIRKLVSNRQLQSLKDVLTLSKEQLQEAGSSREQAGYYRSAIALTGSQPMGQQIRALSIPYIGKARSAKLGKAFSDWDSLLQAKDKELQASAGVAEWTILPLRQFLQTPENQALIKTLKQLNHRQ